MPTHQGLGPDDRNGLEDRWKPSIQLDEEQTIAIREPDATAHLPPQYDQLTSERSVLCLKSALRLERRGEQAQEEAQNRAIIAADVRRFAHVINTDGVLGTHRNGFITMAENGRRVGTPAGDVTSACYDKGIAQTDGGAAPRVTARFGSRKERELVEINLEVKGA
jgi:hypothetical protein